MKDKIEVNEYVRSWNGSIGKVTRIEEGRFLYDNKELICFIGSVVKHSFNIIDLIQEGDYVNGEKVSNIDKIGNTIFLEWINGNMYSTEIKNDSFIYEILTKEQYEANVYKLEE